MRVLLVGAGLLLAGAVEAQTVLQQSGDASVPILPSRPLRDALRGWDPSALLEAKDPGVVTAASLLLPGTGQLLLEQRRWVLYAAAEAAGWLIHLDRGRKGRSLRSEYRDLAWMSARAAEPEPRRDGDFEYYERLEQWAHSGRWDAQPNRRGLQPEPDPTTFNGSIWALARDLFTPNGEGEGTSAYAQALAFYEERAYPPELLWDWTGQQAKLERYKTLIDRSDEALRTATVVLGAVVANHLFSAADAFVSARLAQAPVSAATTIRAVPGGLALEWRIELRP